MKPTATPTITHAPFSQPPADAPNPPPLTASFRVESLIPVSQETLWAYHARPGAFERLAPPWQKIRVVGRSGGIAAGDTLTMKVFRGPIGLTWHAVHGTATPPARFSDHQARGPFAYWNHVHTFEATPEGDTILRDEVAWRLPFGRLGHALLGWMFRNDFDRMFRFRHTRTALDLTRHTSGVQPMRIAITGASGLVGSALVPFLTTAGHDVVRLVRREPKGKDEIRWNPEAGEVDLAALEGIDAVIHLAGENVGEGRWSDARRRSILESRERGTRTIATAIAALRKKPRVFISASGAGFYGDGTEGEGAPAFDETAPAGKGFLADVCRVWESAADPARQAGVRVVHPRIGVVLDPNGGALAKLLTPFRLGVGGRVGTGRQWFSWISMDDLLGVFSEILSNENISGPVNAVAPGAVQQADFARILARVLRRPAFMPLPSFAVKAMFGEMGQSLLLGGARITPAVLMRSGFRFAHDELETALRFMLGR